MATKTSQRVFIWVIAVVMLVGSVGAYFMVILANNNQQDQLAEQQKQLEQLQQSMACQAVDSAGKTFNKPEGKTFEAASVTELRKEDVTSGTGDEVTTPDACLTVHYLGSTPDGKVFDESYSKGQPAAFRLDGVIQGWQAGLQGMKVGGVRDLYIPAAQAYGEQGSPPNIAPNTPLYFRVELIGINK